MNRAIHCVFAGLSFMMMDILNVKIGMTFSGGLIDYFLFGILPNRTAWWVDCDAKSCDTSVKVFDVFLVTHRL